MEHFDYVTIATGSFNEPREVQTPGFTGEQLHAREWSGGKDYKGKTVVIVGGADSANDIVLLLLKYGAKRVVQSIRNIDQNGRNLVYDPESDTNVRTQNCIHFSFFWGGVSLEHSFFMFSLLRL